MAARPAQHHDRASTTLNTFATDRSSDLAALPANAFTP
jgi:hypothetical protein